MQHPDHPLTEAKRYGYVEDGGVWLRPVLGQPARRIGSVKGTDDDALRYFAQRYTAFQAKIDELLDRLQTADNQGSYLMKLLHLQEQTKQHDGLGDYQALYDRLHAAEEQLNGSVARNREKNLVTKRSLIAQAEALRDTVDWVAASETVKELRQAWLKTGPVDKQLTEELENRFHTEIQGFFDRRKAFQLDRKALTRRTVERYRELVWEAEKLKNSEQFEATSRQLKQLQTAWRDVNGNLPKKQAAELWTKFRAANNHFFERLKKHIESQRPAEAAASTGVPSTPEQSLVRKRELARRAEGLLGLPPAQGVTQAKALQAEWKQSGAVRGPESDQLWQRFMLACDKVFEMSALDYYLRKRQGEGGEPLGPAERAQASVVALRKFIESDRQELATLRDNLGKLPNSAANDQHRQLLQGKIRTFERKVQTKTELIALFQQAAGA
ncbi:DUF349 domain-containing protein [Hymenobacter sp. RP-2-7]|uniref:DUF349 domain-containing protein n=1 Tax=Hymenobacter polaris TaxID=2682546 RepID=A0A7Y0AGF4_9BACT|nr:DUF349 domain-containing protein [Hymenobacter polaris]NML66819.1 DUF349 domain-containing protein [Hymenobacter polaris]